MEYVEAVQIDDVGCILTPNYDYSEECPRTLSKEGRIS